MLLLSNSVVPFYRIAPLFSMSLEHFELLLARCFIPSQSPYSLWSGLVLAPMLLPRNPHSSVILQFPKCSNPFIEFSCFSQLPLSRSMGLLLFSNALIPSSGLLSLLTACPFKAVCAIVSLPQLPCAVCSRFRRILLALAGLPRILKV